MTSQEPSFKFLYAYKVHGLELDDRLSRMDLATYMLRRIHDDAEFLNHIMLCDEACFHLSGVVNQHNVCIW